MNTGPLSLREAQLVQLLAWGHSTEQSAEMMGIAVNTAKNHLRSAALKLGTNNTSRVSTVVACLRLEIVSLQPPSPLGKFWKE